MPTPPVPLVLGALLLLAPTADAATVTVTDANGNSFTFEDVPCCYDWSFAPGTSCVDDCVIAGNGGGPPIQTAVAQAARIGGSDGLSSDELDGLGALLASRLGVDTLDTVSVYLRNGKMIDRVDDRGRTATSPEALLCTDALLVYTVCTDSAVACEDLSERDLADGVSCAAPPTDTRGERRGR